MDRILTETEREDIIKAVERLKESKREELRLLDNIASEAKFSAVGKLRNKAARYADLAEKSYLDGKRIATLTSLSDAGSDYDYEIHGITNTFPAALSYDGDVWEFYLPPVPSVKIGKASKEGGRAIRYIVRNLIKTHEETYGEIKMLEAPIAVFEFGFSKDNSFTRLFDAENKDKKSIIDAMTEKFISDDNILALTTMYYGTMSDQDYTKVFLLELAHFPLWIGKNSQSE